MTDLVPLDQLALAIPEEVTIPPSIDDAVMILDAVGGLLTAGKWGTAAIVYAYTEEGVPGSKPQDLTRSNCSRFALR